MTNLSIEEQKVLDIINSDSEGWFNHFYPEIVNACNNNLDLAYNICRNLRRLKLVDAQGRGKFAQYGKKIEKP